MPGAMAETFSLANVTNGTTPTAVVTEVVSLLAPLTPIGRHLLAVFCILLGLLALFAGKKYFRTTLFMLGFGCGFCFAAIIVSRFDGVDDKTTLIVASVAGAIGGGLGACVGAAAKAIMGLGIAGFLTYGFVRIGGVSAIGDDTVIWVVIAICAALSFFVIWKAVDAATVVVTSLGGALLVIVSISHFIPELRLEPLEVFAHPSQAICTTSPAEPGVHQLNGTIPGNGTVHGGGGGGGGGGEAANGVNGCVVELVAWATLSALGLVCQWKLWECTDDNRKSRGEHQGDEDTEDLRNVEIGARKKSWKKEGSKRRATAAPTRGQRRNTLSGSKSKSAKYSKGTSGSLRKKKVRSKSTYTRVPARDRRSGW